MTESKEKIDLSEGLDRLEQIVEELEDETADLDKSIELFKEGVELADRLRDKLKNAELELKEVVEDAEGSFSWEDLEI